MQAKDPSLKPMIKYLTDGILPDCNNEARPIQLQSADFPLIKGVLYHLFTPPGKGPRTERVYLQLVIQGDLVFEVLQRHHDELLEGHPGIAKTLALLN